MPKLSLNDVAGEECLHLIYPLTPPQLYFTFVDCYFFDTSFQYIIMLSLFTSCCLLHMHNAHAAHNLQTFAYYSISSCNFIFLHPVFCHLFSDLWSDQLSARFYVNVRNSQFQIFISIFEFCSHLSTTSIYPEIILYLIVLSLGLAKWTWVEQKYKL